MKELRSSQKILLFSLMVSLCSLPSASKAASQNDLQECKSRIVELTIANLYSERKCIPAYAWSHFSDVSKGQENKIKRVVGPTTKPWFGNLSTVTNFVNMSFPNREFPTEVFFIYYNYKDLAWAKKTLISLISQEDYENFSRNENGRVTESNCETSRKNCIGSKALLTSTNIGIILLGVPNKNSFGGYNETTRMTSGMLEAHEYFHTLQDMSVANKGLDRFDWPPVWITEGSAEYVQNAIINRTSFAKYLAFRKSDSSNLYSQKNIYNEKFIMSYIDVKNYQDGWQKFDGYLAYNLGSRLVEILVAWKGQDSIIALHDELAKKIGFEASFENVYGAKWKLVQPVLAKVVAAQIASQS